MGKKNELLHVSVSICWHLTTIPQSLYKIIRIVWPFWIQGEGGCPTISPLCLSTSSKFCSFNVWINCCRLVNLNSCFVAHLHFPAWLMFRVENYPDSLLVMNLLVLIKPFFIFAGFFLGLDPRASLDISSHRGKLVKKDSSKVVN